MLLRAPDGHLDAKEMIDRMIEIVPADIGKFRNVVPKAVEDMLKTHQLAACRAPTRGYGGVDRQRDTRTKTFPSTGSPMNVFLGLAFFPRIVIALSTPDIRNRRSFSS